MTKYVFRRSQLFSEIFGIKEEKEEDKKESSEQSKITELENIKKPINNNEETDSLEEKLKEQYLNKKINIMIYYGTKRKSFIYSVNHTISDLINFLNDHNYLSDNDLKIKNFKILFGLEELKLKDKRKIYRIIYDNKINNSSYNEDQIKIILKTKEKEFINDKNVEKIYVSLENIPSFMDLSEQINIFMKKQKKEVKYDIKYKNNCCNIIFLSPEISFSFVSFMINLKFTNKFYRKLRIKYDYYNTEKKNNFNLNNSTILQNKSRNNNDIYNYRQNNSLVNIQSYTEKSLNDSINKKTNKLSLNNYLTPKKVHNKSYNSCKYLLVNTESKEVNDYFNDKFSSIRESIPYDQEKIINRLEKAKNKERWITNKGFFNDANTKSFNRFINPYKNKNNKKIYNKLSNNKDRKIFLNLNDFNN